MAASESDPLGAFTSGSGKSDEAEKVYYKRLRGETLTREEERRWRAEFGAQFQDEYEVAPF